MSLQGEFVQRSFTFGFKARTSRGLMKDKVSWFVKLWDSAAPSIVGTGEAGPLPGLSPDVIPEVESVLASVLEKVRSYDRLDLSSLNGLVPADFPSIRFALETAWLDLQNGGKKLIYDTDFPRGGSIPINGLIWMGEMDFMMDQINEKVSKGFRCIKLKVGGLDFDRECDILGYIRKRYYREDIELRLDANGAFKLDDALYKLNELAKYNIQSIEQPIKQGLPEMEELCRKSPIAVALDEELIGKHSREDKISMLTSLKPQYIILKPTLVGGFAQCEEWIALAEERGIGWWITSALESSIGLNAICQFTSRYDIKIPQGLGTGAIYTNNISSPLSVSNGYIRSDLNGKWDESI